LQIFDCKGNGIESEINLVKSQVDYPRMKKTGKWISHSDSVRSEVLICAGKCTISFSLRNASNIVAFSGEGEIIIDSKEYSRFKIDNHGLPQSVLKKDFGNRSSTVRLSGTNIGIYRPLIVKSGFGKSKEIYRRTAAPEQPVLEMEQKKLSLLGFSKNDFDENWNVIPIAKGTTLESPTLDFCFDNFNSESNRVARRQVVAIKESSPYLFVSTEVVRYKSKVAGIEAQSELTSRIEDCVRNGGFRNADGIFQDYQFLPIEGFNGKYKVIDNGIMLYVKIGIDNSARYLLAYYQFNDGVLSGMYVVKPYQSAFTREELAKWEQIRSKLSFRLLNNSGV
jgi:hypothetical protein